MAKMWLKLDRESELRQLVDKSTLEYEEKKPLKDRIRAWLKLNPNTGKRAGVYVATLKGGFFVHIERVWGQGYPAFVDHFFQNEESPSTEVREHPDPAPWGRVNHSHWEIRYKEDLEDGVKSRIRQILREGYGIEVREETDHSTPISQVDEPTGSLNYRVECEGEPSVVLFRVHVLVRTEHVIKALHKIQKIVANRVYSGSRFGRCLIPLRRDHPKNAEFRMEEFPTERAANRCYVTVFPFAENVVHFSGEAEAQIESFARQYGRIQREMRTLVDQTVHDLATQLGGYTSLGQQVGVDQKLFDILSSVNGLATDLGASYSFVQLWHRNASLLEEAWHKSRDAPGKEMPILLHDVHPHNTFFYGDECVLIYDYERVMRYASEEDAVAFTMHRFIREHIRNVHEGRTEITRSFVDRLVRLFLKAYQEGYPNANLSKIREGLCEGIWRANFPKLIDIMLNLHRIKEDPAGRSETEFDSELVKFMMFVREAKFFEPLPEVGA